jgi:hypothetical protein
MMKKFYILIVVILMNSFLLSAQIRLRYQTHGILSGEVYKYFYADTTGFIPGTGSAGKMWSYPSLTIGANLQLQNYLDPATTPYASSFPTATYAIQNSDGYEYYKSNSVGTYMLGTASTTSNAIIPYLDEGTMFVYPFTYNSSISSEYFSGIDTVLGVKYKVNGQITTRGDGYGKLVINGITYDSILRVKVDEILHYFEINIPTDTVTKFRFETLKYQWYRNNSVYPYAFKNPIINYIVVNKYDLKGSTPTIPVSTTKEILIDNHVTGINDYTQQPVNLNVYPNPTTGFVNLETNYTSPQKINIELTNASGQVVYFDMISVGAGKNVQKLDVSKLPLGIYAIRMYNDESVVVRKLILQ